MSRLAFTLCLFALFCLAGCSHGPDPGIKNLELLAQYYNQYASEHRSMAPPDEATFKQYLSTKNVADADKLFVSPRDKQPYKIKYGVSTAPDYSKGLVTPDQAGNQIVIAEEQTGVGGKRQAAYNSGVIKEVQ